MSNNIIEKSKGDALKPNLMRSSLISITIKLIGIGFSLMTGIVLARVLGPEQYGIYSYVLAIVSILAIPAMFGLPSLIVRETAKSEVSQRWGLIRGLWYWANSITVSLSIIIALIAMAMLWLSRDSFTQLQLMTFAWGIAFIPLSSLAALRGASLRGLKKVIQGQLPEQVLKPLFFIVILISVSLLGNTKVTAQNAMMFNALSAGIAFIFGAWLLLRESPKQFKRVTKEYDSKAWIGSVIPLAMIAGLDIVVTQTDIIMLGFLSTATEVGVYRVAVQGAMLVTIGISATNMVMAPYLSKFSANYDMVKMKSIATQSARISFFIAFFSTLFFGFFGKELITLVFGESYITAYLPLFILAISQSINAGVGAGGVILNMNGYEKSTMFILFISALINVILNFIFIPLWGIVGAALATAIAIIIRKIITWYMVYFKLNIDSSIVGVSFRNKYLNTN